MAVLDLLEKVREENEELDRKRAAEAGGAANVTSPPQQAGDSEQSINPNDNAS